jgi:cytochrome P450
LPDVTGGPAAFAELAGASPNDVPRAGMMRRDAGGDVGVERVAMSYVAAVGRRPWLSSALFRFTKRGNPFADERFIWPYPMYDRMRIDGPIAYGRPYRQWFVFGYDEVQEVLRSPHTATAPVGELLLSISRYRKLSPSARSNFSTWLLVNDAPDHTRLRSSVGRAFTPGQIDRYEPLVGQVVGELLGALETTREADIVEAFTSRLPIEVIATVLGLPVDRRPRLLSASREIGGMLEQLTPFDPASMSERFAELDTYFRAVIAQGRRDPGHDLISALAATDDGHAVDDDEIVG